MKALCLCIIASLSLLFTRANTYYSTNNADPGLTSSWHTNRNGTGSTPANFNGTDIFVIQSNHTMNTSANWNLGGANATIIVESNGTLQANNKITVDILQLNANATYIHNDNSSAFPGSNTRMLSATSTVQ